MPTSSIKWTNKSVKALAKERDPFEAIESATRELVHRAREQGWSGPPFDPSFIAEMLGVPLEGNAEIRDARLVQSPSGAKIEFNPKKSRERIRFSIAHEVSHLLFPDWAEAVRYRGGQKREDDDWQLELLCNIAASEFIMPIGSLCPERQVKSIEELMKDRRKHDVSAEAFLIRTAKISNEPVVVFVASPNESNEEPFYQIDYSVSSPTSSKYSLSGRKIPETSVIALCRAIGYTDSAFETWVDGSPKKIECVGIPAYPGQIYPRVAGLVRLDPCTSESAPIRHVHGDVLKPRGDGKKFICQMVNDRALRWGGGVAKKAATKYPEAEKEYSRQLSSFTPDQRLGSLIVTEADENIFVASLVAQEGFGKSTHPRIRYQALERSLRSLAERARNEDASIHMPRIGTGSARGDWNVIEELIDDILVRQGVPVTVYDPPPKRQQMGLF